jgi:hypothetical protein
MTARRTKQGRSEERSGGKKRSGDAGRLRGWLAGRLLGLTSACVHGQDSPWGAQVCTEIDEKPEEQGGGDKMQGH